MANHCSSCLIAEYFRDLGYEVVAEADCHELLGRRDEQKLRSFVNYDLFAEKGRKEADETIILELKWLKDSASFKTENWIFEKKGNKKYQRIMVVLIKLAIPHAEFTSKRLAIVVRDKSLVLPSWFTNITKDNPLELKVGQKDQTIAIEIKNDFDLGYSRTRELTEDPFSEN